MPRALAPHTGQVDGDISLSDAVYNAAAVQHLAGHALRNVHGEVGALRLLAGVVGLVVARVGDLTEALKLALRVEAVVGTVGRRVLCIDLAREGSGGSARISV